MKLTGALVKQSLQKVHFHTIFDYSLYKWFMRCSKQV